MSGQKEAALVCFVSRVCARIHVLLTGAVFVCSFVARLSACSHLRPVQLHDAVKEKEQREKDEKKGHKGFFGFGRKDKDKHKEKPVQIVERDAAHAAVATPFIATPPLSPLPPSHAFASSPVPTPSFPHIPSFPSTPIPAFSSPPSPNTTHNSSGNNSVLNTPITTPSQTHHNNNNNYHTTNKVERPAALSEPWQMSDELMHEMMTWQKQKENYERDIVPLLQAVCCHSCRKRSSADN